MELPSDDIQLIIYTDGSCLGNPGPGAAAIVVTDIAGNPLKNFVMKNAATTNNRMELMAVIMALKAVPQGNILIIMDSSYVHDGITKWLKGWKAKGWKKADKSDVLNVDLWLDIDNQLQLREGKTYFKRVRGHSGDTGNELADTLANNAAREIVPGAQK